MIENTHEEESIDEIVDFLDTASREAEQKSGEVPGQDVPAAVRRDTIRNASSSTRA